MKRIYLICCIMVFLLGGCRNRSSPQQLSLSDESEEINSFTSSSEELLLEEEYYHYDLFEHVYGFNPWQNTFVLKKDNQIFYQHPTSIETAYYYNHACFYFLSEGTIYRLSLQNQKVETILHRDGIVTFQPLTNFTILYETVDDSKRRFFLFNHKTQEEKEVFPEAYGYDDRILRNRFFALSPENLYDIENQCIIPNENNIPRFLSYDEYFSQERAYEFGGEDKCFLPHLKTFYAIANGVFSPLYQTDMEVDTKTYSYMGNYLIFFSSGNSVYRVFLPGEVIEEVYSSESPFHWHPYHNKAIILFEKDRKTHLADENDYIYYYNLETKEKTLLSKEIYQEKYSLLD